MRSRIIHLSFATDHFAISHTRDNRLVRAIIAGKQNQGIVAHTRFDQLAFDFSNNFVHMGHHVAKILSVTFIRFRPFILRVVVSRSRCWTKWTMGQNHRIVNQKRLLLVRLYKLTGKIANHIGTKFALGKIKPLPVGF